MSEFKTCTKCKVQKYTIQFNKDSSKKDGLRSNCTECQSAAYAVYRADNIEDRRAAERKRDEGQRDKNRKRYKQYRTDLTDGYVRDVLKHRGVDNPSTHLIESTRIDLKRKREQGLTGFVA